MPSKSIETDYDNEIIDEIEENVLPPDNIVVLNELRSVSDLNRLMSNDEAIDIQPDFQRNEVWTDAAKARFIDSLAKEFPIPSMCFALDPKEQKYVVIDGLQRMLTIKKLFKNNAWVLPKLQDIDEKISGKSICDIRKEYPKIFRRIENISLPLTILRYDPDRNDNMEYIFTIFQRLNTYGDRLNNQEIRNAIYQGPFNSFIKRCAQDSTWKAFAKGKGSGRKSRMITEERALRFFAFFENLSSYDGKLNRFLNNYIQKKRNDLNNDTKETIFLSVMNIVKKLNIIKIGKSNALRDAVLYGISKNLEKMSTTSITEIEELIKQLNDDENFSVSALSGGVMQKGKVLARLTVAEKIFAGK